MSGIRCTAVLSACLFFLLCKQSVWAQQGDFDYSIADVQMFEVDAAKNLTPVDGLEAYLYDIGPQPRFVFEVTVKQHSGKSPNARRSRLVVERYLLLAPTGKSVYADLPKAQPDVVRDTSWVYHGPVALDFTRKQTGSASGSTVTFTSAPHQMIFLDPSAPITFARPADFFILGYAYRFLLVPANLAQQDINPADNAHQLTFMKP